MQNHYHTIVVGAGAAGLMAARELSASGKKILILEARDRIGGRIHTISHDGLFLESGAEFIHGHLLLTMELLKRAGIEYCRISGEMEMSTEGDELEKTEEPTDHWGELMRKMGKLETDMTVRDFLDLYFPGKKYEALRKSVTGFAQGFDLADLQNASTLAIYEEWKNEPGDQYRIRGGYSLLMAWLADECIKNGCELMLNQEVNQVRWARGQVSVGTLQNFSIQAEKILVTIPLSLLQGDQKKGSIRFDPLLTHHMKWFNAIGFGSVIKMILSFKNPFWEAKSKEMGFIISDQPVPTWWSQEPDKNNYLTGWLGGPPASNFPKDSDAALNDALQSLAAIFKLSLPFLRKELKSYHLFNWENEPYSFGAYSYAMPETTEARKQLNQSVDNTIFFAGEALHGGEMPGTVEAALMSGKEAAHKING